MALTYKEGKPKVRPNIYQRYSTTDNYDEFSYDGTVGVVVNADWGDVEDVTIVRSTDQARKTFGTGGTTDVIEKAFLGGAVEVYVARLSSPEAAYATTTIEADTGRVFLQLKNPGNRDISIQIKPDLTVENRKNVTVLEDGEILETFSYRGGEGKDEIDEFVSMLGDSKFIDVVGTQRDTLKLKPQKGDETNPDTVEGVKAVVTTEDNKIIIDFKELAEGYTPAFQLKMGTAVVAFQEDRIKLSNEGNVYTIEFSEKAPYKAGYTLNTRVQKDDDKSYKTVVQTAITIEVDDLSEKDSVITPVATQDFTGGANPVITNESYSNAFTQLEKYRYNTLVVDTVNEDVVNLAAEFVNRLYENGRYTILVVGCPSDFSLYERIKRAQNFNNHNIVCVGSGYIATDGSAVDEALIASQIAGMIAYYPCNRAITAKKLNGSSRLITGYTTEDYERAIESGLLTLSLDDDNNVVVEAGITTLTDLEKGIDDKGWKKIKRTKTRNELFLRVTRILNPIRSDVTPDDNGKAYVQALISGVIQEMAAENKLANEYQITITNEIDEPDSICFDIQVYDYDVIEKFYLHYIFTYRKVL